MKPKNTANSNVLKEIDRVKNYYGDPIDERWWVEEYFPAHDDNDGFYIGDRHISKSKYFKTENQAEVFMEGQVTDHPGYRLRLRHEYLYEYTQRRWM